MESNELEIAVIKEQIKGINSRFDKDEAEFKQSLDAIDKKSSVIQELVYSIKDMCKALENLDKKVDKIDSRVSKIENEPVENFKSAKKKITESILSYLGTALAGGLVTALIWLLTNR